MTSAVVETLYNMTGPTEVKVDALCTIFAGSWVMLGAIVAVEEVETAICGKEDRYTNGGDHWVGHAVVK